MLTKAMLPTSTSRPFLRSVSHLGLLSARTQGVLRRLQRDIPFDNVDDAVLTAAAAEFRNQAGALSDWGAGLFSSAGPVRLASRTAALIRSLPKQIYQAATEPHLLFDLAADLESLKISKDKLLAARLEPIFKLLAENSLALNGRTGEIVHRARRGL